MTHTVEKIGGTSMSRLDELRDTLIVGDRDKARLYGRIFVVSAFAGITDLLLEQKKSGAPGAFAAFMSDDTGHAWHDRLDQVARAMTAAHARVLDHPADIDRADAFVHDRVLGARNCLIDLQRLCAHGHFRLSEHAGPTRELLSGLGEAHSAFVATLLLQRAGLPLPAYPHLLRHACGYALADQGADTRLIQDYLGHRNIQHTVRYTAANPARFERLWR